MLFSHDTCWFLSSLFPCLKVWRDQTLACDAIGMFLCPSDGHKWALFQYKSSFSMYSNCPCGDKTVRMSYLYHNGNFSPCGMTALYWNRALVSRWLRHMAWWSLLKLQSWWWVGVGGYISRVWPPPTMWVGLSIFFLWLSLFVAFVS